MPHDEALTALVLAGARPGGDPLAAHAGVSHKALIDLGGRTMIEHVVAALAASPRVRRIVVCIDRPDLVESLPGLQPDACGKPVAMLRAASGPSASVAAALDAEGTPLLVVTGDHPLLRPSWIETLAVRAPVWADAVVALAPRAAVLGAVPDTRRTWLAFADGAYSGCNLFLLRRPAARGVVELWQRLETARKRPLRMILHLGVGTALRYGIGRLRLDDALARLGTLSGGRVGWVALTDGRAAIDVDKPDDLETVRRLMVDAAA